MNVSDVLKLVAISICLLMFGYLLGYSTGVYKGENTGLRAQDAAVIKALGVTNANLNSELKIANLVLGNVAELDSTGRTEVYMRQAIQRFRDNK